MSRIRIPIIVTRTKLLGPLPVPPNADDRDRVLDVVEDAKIVVTNRDSGQKQPVYRNPSDVNEILEAAMKSDPEGRFEGWVDRSRISVEVSKAGWSYTEEFDAVSAADGTVDTGWIANGAVTSPKLADGSVIEVKLGDGSVSERAMGTGSVTKNKIGYRAVSDDKIASNAVVARTIDNNAVTTDKILDESITKPKVGGDLKGGPGGEYVLRRIGTGANDSASGDDARLKDKRDPNFLSVGTPELKNDSVTLGKVAPSLKTTPSAGTPALRKLGAGATDAASGVDGRLADKRDPKTNSVGPDEIRSKAVTSAKMADDLKDQPGGTHALRKLGVGSKDAAAGNDIRFTAQIPADKGVITEWIGDGVVRSPHLALEFDHVNGIGSNGAMDKNTGGGLGKTVLTLPASTGYKYVTAHFDIVFHSWSPVAVCGPYTGFSNTLPRGKSLVYQKGSEGERHTVTCTCITDGRNLDFVVKVEGYGQITVNANSTYLTYINMGGDPSPARP